MKQQQLGLQYRMSAIAGALKLNVIFFRYYYFEVTTCSRFILASRCFCFHSNRLARFFACLLSSILLSLSVVSCVLVDSFEPFALLVRAFFAFCSTGGVSSFSFRFSFFVLDEAFGGTAPSLAGGSDCTELSLLLAARVFVVSFVPVALFVRAFFVFCPDGVSSLNCRFSIFVLDRAFCGTAPSLADESDFAELALLLASSFGPFF